MTTLDYVVDLTTGLAIVQPAPAVRSSAIQGTGTLTYRCHTCGELIPKHWEVFFVDPTPGAEWAGYLLPANPPASMTSHHDWHMSEEAER